jgi:TonB family protein
MPAAEPPDSSREPSGHTAATPASAVRDQVQLPPPTPGKIAVLVFVLLTAAFLLVITYGMRTVRQRLPGPVAAPPPTAREPAPAPRGHCKGMPQAERTSPCDDEQIAWCDTAGRRVACCSPGLAAAPDPGACMCPLGGPLDPAAKSQGCDLPPRPAADKPSLLRTMHTARPTFAACSTGAGEQDAEPPIEMTLRLTIAPEGQVFTAEVLRSSRPDALLDECVLEAARRLRFDPPFGGYLDLEYPLDLGRK